MIGGRGETWRVVLPSVRLMKEYADPVCKCCGQHKRLAAFKPQFLYCVGENCGYDPCYPEDVLDRWDTPDVASVNVDDNWDKCHGQYLYLRKEIAEVVLWAFGYDVRPGVEDDVLQRAKDWLSIAKTTCVVWWRKEQSVPFTEYRLAYAEWTLRKVKMRLREMKRAGRIPAMTCVK